MSGKTETREKKAVIIQKFGHKARDTGAPEVQISLLTLKINELIGHFEGHPKDHHSRRGLLKMVGQRRRMLNYLKSSDQKRYFSVLQSLELRR